MTAETIIHKLDHAGRLALSYKGLIMRREDDLLVARCPWPHPETVDVGLFAIRPGDVFYEYYYRDRWFNIFEVRGPDGGVKGWYCNLTCPPEISADGREIRWHDLALDIVVLPDGTHRFEDEDEFEALDPSPNLRRIAAEVRETLVQWAREGHEPFDTHGARLPQQRPPGGRHAGQRR